jgi:hypothetical protein
VGECKVEEKVDQTINNAAVTIRHMTSTASNEEAETAVGNVSSSFTDLRFPREGLALLSVPTFWKLEHFVRLLRRNSHSLAAPFLPEVFHSRVIYISQEQGKVNPFNL